VLGGGQVPAPMFARVSQSASECCPERGRMPSRLAVGLKRGVSTDFDVKLIWNMVIFKNKLIDMQNPMQQPNKLCVRWKNSIISMNSTFGSKYCKKLH